MGEQAQDATGHDALTVIADKGYFKGEDILACEQGGMTTYVPKPLTSGGKPKGVSASRTSFTLPRTTSIGVRLEKS
jgi:hypothetical protein